MNTKIVIGIDGSAPSRSALEWGIERARATDAAVEIFHALDPLLDPLLDGPGGEISARIVRDAEEMLSFAAAFAESEGVIAQTKLIHGDPFDGLVHESGSAELLVIGTHKTGFIQGRSIGSRFIALSAMSRCPVAFIPNVSLISRRGVSLVLDDSPTGRRAAVFAATEAERHSQRLTLIHGERWLDDAGETRIERTTRELTTASETRATIALQLVTLTDGHPLLMTKTVTTRKSLAVEAIDASMTAALVVISHPQARASIGSSSGRFVHDVVLNLGGPVVVVPRSDADDEIEKPTHLGEQISIAY